MQTWGVPRWWDGVSFEVAQFSLLSLRQPSTMQRPNHAVVAELVDAQR
ncbi:hypothetical protein [uncultured Planktomarina sp.]